MTTPDSSSAALPARGAVVGPFDRLVDRVDGEWAVATVTALAGDEFAGRRVGTPGGVAARAWLAARLSALGATAEEDPFRVRSVVDIYAAPTVQWGAGPSAARLAFGREVAVHLASADLPDVRRGQLGVAGTHDPARRWLVVPAGMSLFDAYRDAHDAAGLLLAREVDADGWQYTMLAGPDPGPLPILTLDPASHRAVLETARAGCGWLSGNSPIRRVDATGANLYSRFRTARSGGIEVLLTAHIDGVGDHPGLRQPGAADNASGVAVVLEAARILHSALPDGAGLSIALLDGEEVGAFGSAHHAARLRAAGATPWVINVDGAGHLHEAAAVEAGGPAHALLAVLDQAGRHTGVPLAAGPVASDNRRYAAVGLPTVGIGAGMAGYHTPADTPDRVEATTLAAIARMVVATGWLAATASAQLQSLIGDER